MSISHTINSLITGPIIYVFSQIFNILKITGDIDQQDFEVVDLHFLKSEYFSLT